MERLILDLRGAQALAKLIGKSAAFLRVVGQLPAVAKSDATVLISGETGTGKELVARAIHYLSERAGLPFVPINCGSLPDTLLEDELFGHERGAFTDARSRRSGLFKQADKGTLFLDEVDSLTAKGQVAFLRVLEDKRFRAVGSSCEQQANVRILAATNVPLDRHLKAGAFRADLYYRLRVIAIDLPALRDRKEDIPSLANHFLEKHASGDKAALRLDPAASSALVSYDWPGNVRELENAVIRGIHLCRTGLIEIEDLGVPSKSDRFTGTGTDTSIRLDSFKALKQKTIESFEKDYLIRLMSEHHGNVSHAARKAGKERRELGKLLKKYRIDPKSFYSPESSSLR